MNAKIKLNTGIEVGIAKRMYLTATGTKGTKVDLLDLGLPSPFSWKASVGDKVTDLYISRRPSGRLIELGRINTIRMDMAIEVHGGQVGRRLQWIDSFPAPSPPRQPPPRRM